jgi:DNA-binding NtrC family response regulator
MRFIRRKVVEEKRRGDKKKRGCKELVLWAELGKNCPMLLEKVLIVDDDGQVRAVLHDLLSEKGLTVLAVSSLAQARERVKADVYDLVLCDVKLKDGNGLDFLVELRERNRTQRVVVMTGFASMDSAVKAIRLGVFDYLVKPVEPSMLDAMLERLESVLKLEAENRYLRREVSELPDQGMLWGESDVMGVVRGLVQKAGQSDATVLIQGESGTGKEMVARALCAAGPRSDRPFIKVNCAAVPATLMESEFFGHEKGAFTGAVQRRQGRFELADGGTLLLDEITEIPPELQVKLLRVLQEREFERVGGAKTLRVDVRVIATTNRRLSDMVREGRFREDLFYRLNVFPLELPPLRERGDDVLLLARNFLERFARRHGKLVRGLSAEAEGQLRAYPWPGNVRELQNVLERAVILAEDGSDIGVQDLALSRPGPAAGPSPRAVRPWAEVEAEAIRHALEHFKGNRTHAAAALGISLRTLRNRLAEYRASGVEVGA